MTTTYEKQQHAFEILSSTKGVLEMFAAMECKSDDAQAMVKRVVDAGERYQITLREQKTKRLLDMARQFDITPQELINLLKSEAKETRLSVWCIVNCEPKQIMMHATGLAPVPARSFLKWASAYGYTRKSLSEFTSESDFMAALGSEYLKEQI